MLGLLVEGDDRPGRELLLSSSSDDEERADSMYDGRLLVVLGLVAVMASKGQQRSARNDPVPHEYGHAHSVLVVEGLERLDKDDSSVGLAVAGGRDDSKEESGGSLLSEESDEAGSGVLVDVAGIEGSGSLSGVLVEVAEIDEIGSASGVRVLVALMESIGSSGVLSGVRVSVALSSELGFCGELVCVAVCEGRPLSVGVRVSVGVPLLGSPPGVFVLVTEDNEPDPLGSGV